MRNFCEYNFRILIALCAFFYILMDDLPNEEAANLSQSCRFSVLQLIWEIGRVNIRNLGYFGVFFCRNLLEFPFQTPD